MGGPYTKTALPTGAPCLINVQAPCRSELAREKPESTAQSRQHTLTLTFFASKLAPTEATLKIGT